MALPSHIALDLQPPAMQNLKDWVDYYRLHPEEANHPYMPVIHERSYSLFKHLEDPLADFDRRSAVGQNCAWRLWLGKEHAPLKARLEAQGVTDADFQINTRINYYNEKSKVNERKLSNGTYEYVHDEVWTADINGAADAYVALIASGGPFGPPPPPLG